MYFFLMRRLGLTSVATVFVVLGFILKALGFDLWVWKGVMYLSFVPVIGVLCKTDKKDGKGRPKEGSGQKSGPRNATVKRRKKQ